MSTILFYNNIVPATCACTNVSFTETVAFPFLCKAAWVVKYICVQLQVPKSDFTLYRMHFVMCRKESQKVATIEVQCVEKNSARR